jgi:hypothetical protein
VDGTEKWSDADRSDSASALSGQFVRSLRDEFFVKQCSAHAPLGASRASSQRSPPAALELQLARFGWQVPRRKTAQHALRIEPMKKIARSLRQHRELIFNYFPAKS